MLRGTKQENHKDTQRCILPPIPSLSARPHPPHLVFRVHGRPRCQKPFHHRRMTSERSAMQRRLSLLRRAAPLRQPTPVFSDAVRRWSSNPSGKCSYERPTRGTVCGTMRSMCGADTGCLAINYQSLSDADSIADRRSPCLEHVGGPHLSSDASLPPALRCELDDVDSNGRMVPGVARSWQHGGAQKG